MFVAARLEIVPQSSMLSLRTRSFRFQSARVEFFCFLLGNSASKHVFEMRFWPKDMFFPS